jgi:hypothetical protein
MPKVRTGCSNCRLVRHPIFHQNAALSDIESAGSNAMSSGPSVKNVSPLVVAAQAIQSRSTNQRRSQYTIFLLKFLAVELIGNYCIFTIVRHLRVFLGSLTQHYGWTL